MPHAPGRLGPRQQRLCAVQERSGGLELGLGFHLFLILFTFIVPTRRETGAFVGSPVGALPL